MDKIINNSKSVQDALNRSINIEETKIIDAMLLEEFGQYIDNDLTKTDAGRWRCYPIFANIQYLVFINHYSGTIDTFDRWESSKLKKLCDLIYFKHIKIYVSKILMKRHYISSIIKSLDRFGVVVDLKKRILESVLELFVVSCIEQNCPYNRSSAHKNKK